MSLARGSSRLGLAAVSGVLVFLLTESKPPNKWGDGPDQLPGPAL